MIETLLDFSGLEDISRDLQLLSGAENNRVLREATRAGANVLKEEVVSRAPVRRGKLRRNVVVLSRRSRDGGMESGVHIRGVNPDTGNSDNTMKADKPECVQQQYCGYAHVLCLCKRGGTDGGGRS